MLKFSFTTTREESLEASRFFRGKGASAIVTDEGTGEKKIIPLVKGGFLNKISSLVISTVSFFHQYGYYKTTVFPVQTTLTFSDESIKAEGSAIQKTEIFWRDVKRAVNAKELIALYSLDTVVVLPKRAIESKEIYEELMRLVKVSLDAGVKIETMN